MTDKLPVWVFYREHYKNMPQPGDIFIVEEATEDEAKEWPSGEMCKLVELRRMYQPQNFPMEQMVKQLRERGEEGDGE